ncbi:hypothetical protein LUZ60_004190 [Juncus effusus]|nr:hypothetical protein LUZ60_004190 [Juncus effusus]
MSRLPPRCPLQNKTLSPNAPEFKPESKTLNQNPNFTDQPSWFEDLFTSPKPPNLNPIRRSCSDSEVILDTLSNFPSEFGDNFDFEPIGSEFEAGLNYGPNSPRQKSELSFTESSIVKSVLQNVDNNPLQYLVLDPLNGSGSVNGPASDLAGDLNHSDKNPRRRSGQRSRVRKLQYIAELEQTVDSLQNFGAELATRVASLFQLRAALSMENKNMRRQISSLRQEKLIKDMMSQSLKNEAERLKQQASSGGRHRRSRSTASCFDLRGPGLQVQPDPLGGGINWQMLDFNKMSLGGGAHVAGQTSITRHSSGGF